MPPGTTYALPAQTRIDKYEVFEVLGEGGFGITYRGQDTDLENWVAIKEYLPQDQAVRDSQTHQVSPRTTDIEVLETQYQRIEERRADIVVKTHEAGRYYLLHVEIQNANEAIMPTRMLRYRTDISLSHPGYDIE